MQRALDHGLSESLAPLSTALGLLHVVLAAGYVVVLSGRPAALLSLLAAGSAVLLLGFRLALRSWRPRAGHAHAWGAAIVLLVLVNCLAQIAVTGEMRQTTSLILLLLGAGFLLVSDAWFVVVAGASTAGWLAVALSLRQPSAPLHYGFALLEALVVAGVVHHIRVRTLTRLEAERLALQRELEGRTRADERQRALLQAVPDLFFRMSRDGTFLDAQAGAVADLLMPVEAFLGRKLQEIPFPDELRQRTLAAAERALAGEGLQTLEFALPVADGERAFEARVVRSGPDEVLIISRNVSERWRAETALRESERRYRNLFDATPLPVWVFDVETLSFLAVNEAAVQHYGYSREEFLGMGLERVNAPEHAEQVRGIPLRELPLADHTGVWIHVRKDGTRFEVEISTHALVFGGRRARCAVIQDVTERARVQRFKDRLVGIAAHELRNPLVAVRGTLEMLAESNCALSETERRLLRLAERNSDRMARLIDDLLDLDKAESGELSLAREALPLGDVLVEALGLSAPRAAQQGVALRLDEVPRGAAVVGDRERVIQVVTNLVANALTFSPAGEIVLVSARDVGERFRVEVADRGPGVPEAFRPRLFQRFAQAREVQGSRRGSGLGLAISRGIVEGLEGRIGYEPREGGGSRFYFELPAARVPEQVPPPASRGSSGAT